MPKRWTTAGCRRLASTLAALSVLAVAGELPAADKVSFRNDVMAVLSKAGCNQGTCHGNQQGKNGFKLSLRGESPREDIIALTRDQFNRRVDRIDPDASLLLLKAIGKVPHGGGKRFAADSPEYDILRSWIAQGVKGDKAEVPHVAAIEVTPRERVLIEPERQVQLHVTATFSDGSTRDVTHWAVYTPSQPIVTISADGLVESAREGELTVAVRYLDRQATVSLAFVPARPDFVWHDEPTANFIDEHVSAKLRRLRMNPSPLCTDEVFVRRAYLDLLGILPTGDEARAFVANRAADKRAKLIDALLERPEFADFWALKWSDLLRNEEKALDRKGVQAFHHWIRQSIADGKPLDRFVYELVSARGSTYSQPAANYYRANRDPITRAEATAQLFLGLRLQCAKCHNHPFDRWTQDDYYRWAGFFSRVEYKILELNRPDDNDKHQFDGEQVVWFARSGEMRHPRTDEPVEPKLLGAATPPLDEELDRLEVLAGWITSPKNPYFARVQANRIWFNLFGRGIVDPIDDFRATNLPINPPLLDALAADFVVHGYDLRHAIRTIMNSRTYQRSAEPNDTNAADEMNFSHALVRPLSAEQLLDALSAVTGVHPRFSGYPVGMRATQLPGVQLGRSRRSRGNDMTQFLEKFGKPPRLLTCECERSGESTLGQAFQLISGPAINDLLRRSDNNFDAMLESGRSHAQIIDELYWTALGRAPRSEEATRIIAFLDRAKDRRQGLEDVVWALVNAKEFVLRQ